MNERRREARMYSVLDIAELCHKINKSFCEAIGDNSQFEWRKAPDWVINSAVDGVTQHLKSDLTPEQSHNNWMEYKIKDGWVYGEVKDIEKKTHPCLIPYDELPIEQKVKDYLFKTIVDFYKEKGYLE